MYCTYAWSKGHMDLFVKALCQRKQEAGGGHLRSRPEDLRRRTVGLPGAYTRRQVRQEPPQVCTCVPTRRIWNVRTRSLRYEILSISLRCGTSSTRRLQRKRKEDCRLQRGRKPCPFYLFLSISSSPFWTVSNTTRTSRTRSRSSRSGIL